MIYEDHPTNFVRSLIGFFLGYSIALIGFFIILSVSNTRTLTCLALSCAIGMGCMMWFKLGRAWQFVMVLSLGYSVLRLTTEAASVLQVQHLVFVLGATYILIQLPTIFTRVPFYPTKSEMLKAIESVVGEQPDGCNFADLGCGFGDVLFALAKKFPQSTFIGFELAPLPYINAKLRSFMYPNVIIRYKNFWNDDLIGYDFLYAFLSPEASSKLQEKFISLHDTKVTLLVHSFKLPMVEESKRTTNEGTLYLYKK